MPKPARKIGFYELAILLAVFVGVLILAHSLVEFCFAGGSLDYIASLLELSTIVSAAGYLNKWLDLIIERNAENPLNTILNLLTYPFKKVWQSLLGLSRFELVFSVAGICLSIGLSILEISLHAFSPLHSLKFLLPLIANVSNITGLLSRLGRAADFYFRNPRSLTQLFRQERVNYVLSIVIGASLGVLTAGLILGLVGLSSTATMGLALPMWLAVGVFAITTVGLFASASGYIGRVADFFLGNRTIVHTVVDFFKQPSSLVKGFKARCTSENIATTVGVVAGAAIGLALSITLIATGLSLLPVGAGVPVLVVSLLGSVALVSGLGGLGNRLGVATGKAFNLFKHFVSGGTKKTSVPVSATAEPKLTTQSTHAQTTQLLQASASTPTPEPRSASTSTPDSESRSAPTETGLGANKAAFFGKLLLPNELLITHDASGELTSAQDTCRYTLTAAA